jgi:hypothetical protein
MSTTQDAAIRRTLEAITEAFEAVVAESQRPKGGMRAPFSGDFASVAHLPAVVERMAWWAREARRALGGEVVTSPEAVRLAERTYAALMAAGVRGGPHAWRWASDPIGTTLGDAAAWERLLGELRERSAQAAPGSVEEEIAQSEELLLSGCVPLWSYATESGTQVREGHGLTTAEATRRRAEMYEARLMRKDTADAERALATSPEADIDQFTRGLGTAPTAAECDEQDSVEEGMGLLSRPSCADCCHAAVYHDAAGRCCDADACRCNGYQPMRAEGE